MFALRWQIATVVIGLSALICVAQSDFHRADIDRFLQPYVQSKNSSGAVLVSKNGKEAFKQAYGFAEPVTLIYDEFRGTRVH